MISLYLVRHGEVKEGKTRFMGHTDCSLTDEGKAQMARFVERLGEAPLQAVYASDLTRARAGGQLIADSHSLGLKTDTALRERCWGAWDGLSAKEAERRDPVLWQSWSRDPLSHSPEGAEKPDEFFTRVTAVMKGIIGIHEGENVAIVCHAGVIRAVHAWLTGRWPDGFFDLSPAYGSLHRFDVDSNFKMKQYLLEQ